MNYLKKLISLAFVGLALTASAQNGQVITHKSLSFINGCNLFVPTNAVMFYGATNALFVLPTGAAGLSLSNYAVYYTNAVNVTSNVFLTPGAIKDNVANYCDANGNVAANVALTIGVNSTNLFLPQLTLPNVNNFNSLAQLGTNVLIGNTNVSTIQYTNQPVVTSTNLLTFVFQRAVDGDVLSYSSIMNGTNNVNSITNWSYGNTIQDKFTVTIDNTFYQGNSGVNPVVICTNMPAAFLTGTKAIRLLSITSGSALGSSAGQIINFIKIGGYLP